MFLRRVWRFGDIELPIGKPWFRFTQSRYTPRGFLWPVSWQGWVTFVALFPWLIGSVALFIGAGLSPDSWLSLFWLVLTALVWCFLVGVKTEARLPWDD